MEPSAEELNMLSKGLITGQEIGSLEKKKITLGKDIEKLEKQVSILDGIVANHDAAKAKYADVLISIDSMIETKNAINNEITKLSTILDTKKDLISEIEKYKGMIKVLQQEMKEFESGFSARKQNAEQSILIFKEQLGSLYKNIGNVIDQVK